MMWWCISQCTKKEQRSKSIFLKVNPKVWYLLLLIFLMQNNIRKKEVQEHEKRAVSKITDRLTCLHNNKQFIFINIIIYLFWTVSICDLCLLTFHLQKLNEKYVVIRDKSVHFIIIIFSFCIGLSTTEIGLLI